MHRTTCTAVMAALLGCQPSTIVANNAPAPPPPSSAVSVRDAEPAPSTKVVVSVVIDQFPAWAFAERVHLLPSDGGFARLRRRGTTVTDLRMPHACSDTAPGHAVLYTGMEAGRSGIFGNEVPGDTVGEKVALVYDEETRLIGPDGPMDKVGSSIAALRVPTVADALRASFPRSTIVSISRKDRGAIFGGGRKPNATLWYDKSVAQFVTSTAFAQSYPDWAIKGGKPVPSPLSWDLLDPGFVQKHGMTKDDQPGEGDYKSLGLTFPHVVSDARAAASAFISTPMADEAVVALGTAALADARVDGEPMLLAMSLSATDSIGHTFGPDSWESWDALLRTDRLLGALLDTLDRTVGMGSYAVLVSSDHGVTSLPELAADARLHPWCAGGADRWNRPCEAGERLNQEEIAHELAEAARSALGKGNWIRGVADPYVFFTPTAKALTGPQREKLVAAVTKKLLEHRGVDRVIDVRTIPKDCPPHADESVEALVCRSVVADGPGDLYVLPKAGSFFDPDYVVGKGTSHGTTGIYDRAVTMIAYAPGRVKEGRTIDEPTGAGSFARTLASLLGVKVDVDDGRGVDLTAQ